MAYASSFFVYGISFDKRNKYQLQDLKTLFEKMFSDYDFEEEIDVCAGDRDQDERGYYIISKIDDVGSEPDIFWICGFVHIHNLGNPMYLDPDAPSQIDLPSQDKQTEFKNWILENGIGVDRVGWYTFVNIQD